MYFPVHIEVYNNFYSTNISILLYFINTEISYALGIKTCIPLNIIQIFLPEYFNF